MAPKPVKYELLARGLNEVLGCLRRLPPAVPFYLWCNETVNNVEDPDNLEPLQLEIAPQNKIDYALIVAQWGMKPTPDSFPEVVKRFGVLEITVLPPPDVTDEKENQ